VSTRNGLTYKTSSFGRGLAFTFGAYGVWGLFPIYFAALLPSNPFEVVVYRVVFSLVFCALLVTLRGSWKNVRAIGKNRRAVIALGLAGLIIFIEWEVFIVAVEANLLVATAVGYFLSPLVTVVFGVIFFRERLRRLQWIAVGIGAGAVVVMAFGVNVSTLPIPIFLALCFAGYAVVKKKISAKIGAIDGFVYESLSMVPLAIIQFIVVSQLVGIGLFSLGAGHATLMILSGVLTAIPLLLFAAGAKHLPLSAIGIIQFVTPLFIFLLGVFYFQEEIPVIEWAGIVLVWCALILFSIDMVRNARSRRDAGRGSRGNSVEEAPAPLPE